MFLIVLVTGKVMAQAPVLETGLEKPMNSVPADQIKKDITFLSSDALLG